MRERFADVTPSTCRTAPNSVSTITSQVDNCLSDSEKRNNKAFGSAFKLSDEIQMAKNKTAELFGLGDTMFGTRGGHITVTNEIKERNAELRQKKTILEDEMKRKNSIIQTRNRDFSDHLDATNESKLLSLNAD